MLFNSYTFLIFFCVVLSVYYSISSWQGQKLFLLISSYIFYAAWNPPFIILLWVSTLTDWYLGAAIHHSRRKPVKALALAGSLLVNLGLLGFFKYGNFILENLIALLRIINIDYYPPALNIVLPAGISFYTFQTLSYSLDIYLEKTKPWHSWLDYALYVTFFPQLVAGPIVRSSEFLTQCIQPKPFLGENLGWGLSLLTLGLFEKVVIADALLAGPAQILYSSLEIPNLLAAWGGTLAFSGQIFCDFAGYSSCAIGTALCLGFRLPRNFQFPYAALGFSDFWRRWHITLSTWLRDYLYIPLGGSRQSHWRNACNLMLTMLLGGLWHGASWTFVIWGSLHGGYLIIERSLNTSIGHYQLWQNQIMQWLLSLITFILVCIGWVFFRSQSFSQAQHILAAMFALAPKTATLQLDKASLIIVFIVIIIILATHWCLRHHYLEDIVQEMPWWAISISLALMLYAIATLHGEDKAFIYFQF
jgi:D-alanyl-lipoteichoic acid acyltransferase DltB (MBOAT superfamily)